MLKYSNDSSEAAELAIRPSRFSSIDGDGLDNRMGPREHTASARSSGVTASFYATIMKDLSVTNQILIPLQGPQIRHAKHCQAGPRQSQAEELKRAINKLPATTYKPYLRALYKCALEYNLNNPLVNPRLCTSPNR